METNGGHISTSIMNGCTGNSNFNFELSQNNTIEEAVEDVVVLATLVEIVLMSAIITAALIGNICLCWVLFSDEKLRSVPNKLVLNLAFCGLFNVAANGPFILLTFKSGGKWIFGEVLCQVNGFTTSTYGLASVLTLAVISVNRYQMIRRTTRRTHMWFTNKRIPFLICGVWIFSAMLSLPPTIGWSRYSFIEVRAICTLRWSTDLTYTTFMFALGIFMPFAIIFIAYYRIFILVRKNFKRMRAHTRQSSFRHHNQQKGKLRFKDRQRVEDGNIGAKQEVPGYATPAKTGDEVNSSPYRTKQAIDICILPIDKEYCAGSASVFIATPKYALQHEAVESHHRQSEISWQSYYADDDLVCDLGNVPKTTEATPINFKIDRKDDEKNLNKTCAINSEANAKCTVFQEFESGSSNMSAVDPTGQTTEHAKLQSKSSLRVKKNRSKNSQNGGQEKAGSSSNVRITTPAFLRSTMSNVTVPRDDLRLTVMVFVVLASFMLCWAPITIINFIETVLDMQVSRLLNIIAVFMMFLSAALNPVIYGLMNRNSRRAFYRIFCGWTRKCRFGHRSTTGRNKIADVLA
ncbi:uncharacterized protein [Amphiura filiformis]|uniref:uncharacterized protein n=1 Tax=Amphiura filiformis TaxID=82378 RepID=UPI003B217B1F